LRDDTGTVAWRLELREQLSAPLVWDSGWLIGTTSSGTVLAFRAKDGGLIWRQELGAPIQRTAALAADRVYVPIENGRIVALQVETGEPLWERRLGGAPNDVLALDDRLFVGSNDNYFYSIRARDGEILWRWPTGADVVGLPVVDNQRVYFVSLDNILRGLDRNTGNQRWKRVLPLRPTRGPVVADDLLLISGIPPNVPAYLMKDGTAAGEIAAGGELAAAPHVVTGASRPMVALVTRDIAQGTIVRALVRSVEPPVSAVAPLPNPVNPPKPIAPATPSTAQSQRRAPHVADTR
jgi:outer membrane protein assembly factor BamB